MIGDYLLALGFILVSILCILWAWIDGVGYTVPLPKCLRGQARRCRAAKRLRRRR